MKTTTYAAFFGGVLFCYMPLKWLFYQESLIKVGRTDCIYEWSGLDDRAICFKDLEKHYCGVKCWETRTRSGLRYVKNSVILQRN